MKFKSEIKKTKVCNYSQVGKDLSFNPKEENMKHRKATNAFT